MDTTNSVTLPPKYPSQYTWKIPPLIFNHPHPLQIVSRPKNKIHLLI